MSAGPIRISYSDDRSFVYVNIHPRDLPDGHLEAEVLLEALLETGFSSFEYQLDQQTFEELQQMPWKRLNRAVVRRIAHRVEFDLKVSFSPDQMEAYATIRPIFAGEKIRPERLRERLHFAKVEAGILPEAESAILEAGMCQNLLVAVGTPAQHGQDGWLERLIPPGSPRYLPLVSPGMPLMRWHPPQPGQAGFTVTGQTLPARDGQDIQPQPGPGCDVSPGDVRLLVATAAGLPLYSRQGVRVEPLEVHDSHTLTNPFHGEHSLRLLGDLPPNQVLTSAGHLIIEGRVSGGRIEAGGDIVITGPVTGPVWLRSSGNLHLGDVSQGLIWAGGQLHLNGCLENCRVLVNGVLQGEGGSLYGGRLHCRQGGQIGELGHAECDPTDVQWGAQPLFAERLQTLQAELKELRHQLDALIQAQIRARAQGNREAVQSLRQQQNRLRLREDSYHNERDALLANPPGPLELLITRQISEGVSLHRGDQTLHSQATSGPVLICESANGLTQSAAS
ncbi:MAG: flagellar assembly protein A [Candidatus Sericytochromatia bacterium]